MRFRLLMVSPSSLPHSVCCISVASCLHLRRRFEHHLARHTRRRLDISETAIWNGAGLTSDGLGELSSATRVWFGAGAGVEPSSRYSFRIFR